MRLSKVASDKDYTESVLVFILIVPLWKEKIKVLFNPPPGGIPRSKFLLFATHTVSGILKWFLDAVTTEYW